MAQGSQYDNINYPDKDEMDQETAKFLFRNLAILIVEDMPIGTEFCFDLTEVQVGKNFKGIKMIPPGVHYICSSARDKRYENQFGPRTGFMHFFKPQEILLVRWCEKTEDFATEDFDANNRDLETKLQRYKDNLHDLDRYLGAYRFSTHAQYVQLVNYISEKHLKNLTPSDGRLRSATHLVHSENDDDVKTEEKTRRQRLIPGLSFQDSMTDFKTDPKSAIRFTQIPTQYHPEQATPSEITHHFLDSSYQLETIISKLKKDYKGDNTRIYEWIIGEIQFAFVTFLIGQIYDSFEYWKSWLRLICCADKSLTEHPKLFIEFLKMLRPQIDQISQDLFVDIVGDSRNNFLHSHLSILLTNIYSAPTDQTEDNFVNRESLIDELKERGHQFRPLLEQKFGWQFDDDGLIPEDERPVIVEGVM